uniref:Uncharacterized protein n=1 Tax=Anguilla anguilla TaxID=7936 RepID=A0A0E9T5W3_ANGAN
MRTGVKHNKISKGTNELTEVDKQTSINYSWMEKVCLFFVVPG